MCTPTAAHLHSLPGPISISSTPAPPYPHPQVLAMLCVVFVMLLLQVQFRPYGCRMLDTLQRGSLYVLNGTCLAVMLMVLSEDVAGPDNAKKVALGALAVAAVINAGLVLVFLCAMALEARRMAADALEIPEDAGLRETVRALVRLAASKLPAPLAARLRGSWLQPRLDVGALPGS